MTMRSLSGWWGFGTIITGLPKGELDGRMYPLSRSSWICFKQASDSRTPIRWALRNGGLRFPSSVSGIAETGVLPLGSKLAMSSVNTLTELGLLLNRSMTLSMPGIAASSWSSSVLTSNDPALATRWHVARDRSSLVVFWTKQGKSSLLLVRSSMNLQSASVHPLRSGSNQKLRSSTAVPRWITGNSKLSTCRGKGGSRQTIVWLLPLYPKSIVRSSAHRVIRPLCNVFCQAVPRIRSMSRSFGSISAWIRALYEPICSGTITCWSHSTMVLLATVTFTAGHFSRGNLSLSAIDLGMKLPDAPESNMTSMDCPPVSALNTKSVLPTLGSEDSHSHSTCPLLLSIDRNIPLQVLFCGASPSSRWSFSDCDISRSGTAFGICIQPFREFTWLANSTTRDARDRCRSNGVVSECRYNMSMTQH